MSAWKGEPGTRWIEAEVKVPGTPEEVRKAVATGPCISSWFMHVGTNEDESEQRVGGAISPLRWATRP